MDMSKRSSVGIFQKRDDGQVEFVKEKLNYKDKLLIVGVDENEEFKEKISKYECFIEKK